MGKLEQMAKIAGLFPGQGSQMVGMGADLAGEDLAAELFSEADRVLGFSLSQLCFKGPLDKLTLTENAQPALLVVSYAAYCLSKLPIIAAAGHSLGEYSALVAAGSISFTDAVQVVHKRGCYMQEAVAPGRGKMLAVLGPSEAEIREALSLLKEGIAEVANLNCPGQTVVAGDIAGIEEFSKNIADKAMKIILLNVSAPFHCSLMLPAAEKLAKDLDATSFADPKFPVYANVSASAVKTGAEARELLKSQVCSSVRWTESIQNMSSKEKITHVIEFGPGGVLTKLVKRINKDIARLEVYDLKSLDSLKANL